MPSAPRRSVLYSAGVVVGLVLCVGGAVMAVLDVGPKSSSEVAGGGVTVKTTAPGLAVAAIGLLLAGGLLLRKPAGVELYGGEPSSGGVHALVDRWAPPAVLFVGAILLVCAIAFWAVG